MDSPDRFQICVAFVLAHETEYHSDGSVKVERDPADPGGTTKFGIDQRSHPNVNVAALTKTQAIEIYRAGEWTKCRCADLKPGWDLAVLDAAVNLGASKAISLAQQAIGVKVDGFIGPVTVAKILSSSLDALTSYLDLRRQYYESLSPKLFQRFGRGWLQRVVDVEKAVFPIVTAAGGPST